MPVRNLAPDRRHALTPVILHIGTHKTGSTFLQQWLVQNRQLLARHGYNTVKNLTNFHRIAAESVDVSATGHRTAPEFLNQELEPIFSNLTSRTWTGTPTAIVSSEYYWNSHPETVFNLYESQNMRVDKIICFIRRQDRLLASTYNQAVKALGRSRPFKLSSYWSALDWSQLFERWSKAFPKAEICVHGYDLHQKNGTLLQTFKSEIGFTATDWPENLPTTDQSNLSFDAEMLEIARLANQRGLFHLPRALSRLQAHHFSGPPFGLGAELTREIEEIYRPGNMKLAQKVTSQDIQELAEAGWESRGADFTGRIPQDRLVQLLKHFSSKLASGGSPPSLGCRDPHFGRLLAAIETSDADHLSHLLGVAAADPQFNFGGPEWPKEAGDDTDKEIPVDLALDLLALAASEIASRAAPSARRRQTPTASASGLEHGPVSDFGPGMIGQSLHDETSPAAAPQKRKKNPIRADRLCTLQNLSARLLSGLRPAILFAEKP